MFKGVWGGIHEETSISLKLGHYPGPGDWGAGNGLQSKCGAGERTKRVKGVFEKGG